MVTSPPQLPAVLPGISGETIFPVVTEEYIFFLIEAEPQAVVAVVLKMSPVQPVAFALKL
jgi:hypothetical protein